MQNMSVQRDAKALVRRFVELGVNQGQVAIVDDLFDPAWEVTTRPGSGVQHLKHWLTLYRSAVPDAYWTIDWQLAEGDTVVTCFTAVGTHQGPCFGIAPTGQHMVLQGVLFSRCADDKIVAQWAQLDWLDLLQQLGVMPPLTLDKAVAVARLASARAAERHE